MRLSNSCLDGVARLSQLRDLNLRGCLQISHEGLRVIASLKKLESLDLTCCPAVQGANADRCNVALPKP